MFYKGREFNKTDIFCALENLQFSKTINHYPLNMIIRKEEGQHSDLEVTWPD